VQAMLPEGFPFHQFDNRSTVNVVKDDKITSTLKVFMSGVPQGSI